MVQSSSRTDNVILWERQPAAAALVSQMTGKFVDRNEDIARLEQQLRTRTGTRLLDWVDHFALTGNDPAVFCWYELTREKGRPKWTRHQFDHNSGPGTQFQLADVNGDKLLDVVTSNKKGVHLFIQVRD